LYWCNADCDGPGNITLEVSGGNGAYTFDWADLNGNTDPQDRADLNPGVYNLTVTDQNGCIAIANNLTVADACIPCPFSETVYFTMDVEETITECIVIEDCFDPSQTNISLLDGSSMGNSPYGSWTLDAQGCLTYQGGLLEGEFVDTVCVVADFDGLVDTTCFIFSILNNPISGSPEQDTIYVTTNEEVPFTDCIALDELTGDFESISVWYGPVNSTGTFTLDPLTPCFTYTPNPGQTGNFIDTMAVIVCDDLGICDTTVIITSVIPQGCAGIIIDEAVDITVTECFELGFYCLPVNPIDLLFRAISRFDECLGCSG